MNNLPSRWLVFHLLFRDLDLGILRVRLVQVHGSPLTLICSYLDLDDDHDLAHLDVVHSSSSNVDLNKILNGVGKQDL